MNKANYDYPLRMIDHTSKCLKTLGQEERVEDSKIDLGLNVNLFESFLVV